MLFHLFFIFIRPIISDFNKTTCTKDQLLSEENQLTPNSINKNNFCNIAKPFNVSFGCDPGSKFKITRIPDYLFYNCSIKKLLISKEIITIGISSFSYCKINELIFEKTLKLTEICNEAFYNVLFTKEFQLPDSLIKIGNGTFYSC